MAAENDDTSGSSSNASLKIIRGNINRDKFRQVLLRFVRALLCSPSTQNHGRCTVFLLCLCLCHYVLAMLQQAYLYQTWVGRAHLLERAFTSAAPEMALPSFSARLWRILLNTNASPVRRVSSTTRHSSCGSEYTWATISNPSGKTALTCTTAHCYDAGYFKCRQRFSRGYLTGWQEADPTPLHSSAIRRSHRMN